MPDSVTKHPRLLLVLVVAAAMLGLFVAGGAAGKGVGQLSNDLSQTQSHEQSLSDSISALNSQVAKLSSQIALVSRRAAQAEQTLEADDAAVRATEARLTHQKHVLKRERTKLALAQKILKRQVVSQYEQPQQSLITVILNAHGFSQLLSTIQYMKSAQQQQQAVINFTRAAKRATVAAERHVSKLEIADITAANHASTQADALNGMKSLLTGRQLALSQARIAQSDALAASKAHGAALQAQINRIREQEAAAQRAAQATPPASSTAPSGGASGGSFAYDGWAIPYAIVLCESGGQNLPPNSAGASGYYQIVPGTWKDYGGSGAAAYQASKAEQSAVAAKIWAGGAGASNWVCASIVGYH